MKTHESRVVVLAETPVIRAIITMAAPVILGMLVQVFYNMADTFFIGKLNDVNQLAASGISFPFFMLMMSFGMVIGVGTSSLVSRFLGMKKRNEAGEIVSLSIVLNVIVAAILTPILLIFLTQILHMLGAREETIEPTRSYLFPLICCSVITISNFSLGNIIRSEGAAFHAMTGMMLGAVTNIILDPIMIFTLKMEISGAAWATVIGNLVSVGYYLSCYAGKSLLRISFNRRIFRLDYLKGILSIGVPSGLNHVFIGMAIIITNNLASNYGAVALAALGVAQRINSLAILFLVGLATGCQPLVGYNYGAKNRKRLFSIIKTSMALAVISGLVLSVIFAIFSRYTIAIFSKNQEVIKHGTLMLRAMALSAPFVGVVMICMNSLQAMGKAIPSLILSAGRQGVFFIPTLFLFTRFFGLNGLIFSQPTVDIMISILAALLLRFVVKHDKNLITETSLP
ncbi:MAG TPA: MATE family efflux transporter [Treponema sp.]|nr:MATE family efflux transporter [Treponema sp.]